MTASFLILLAPMLVVDKAVEAGRADSKPVLCQVHDKSWPGDERAAATLNKFLGSSKTEVVLAQLDAIASPDLAAAYNVPRGKFPLLMLDPFQRNPADRVLAILEGTEEERGKALSAGFERWKAYQSSRAVVARIWEAARKEDLEKFDDALWPPQVADNDDLVRRSWMRDRTAEWLDLDQYAWVSAARTEIPDRAKGGESPPTAAYTVKLEGVDSQLKKWAYEFTVIESDIGYWVIWPDGK